MRFTYAARPDVRICTHGIRRVAGTSGRSMWADSLEVWPSLLEIARNAQRPARVRKSALFWLGQEAAGAVTRGLIETAEDGAEAQDIRDAAVFAPSQRPADEGIPALMELTRTGPTADTRRSALFWLAQSGHPSVPDFFGALLREAGAD
ncbi:MAG: hypothetical protein WD995_13325 [Gemmatimonadota bacterium]